MARTIDGCLGRLIVAAMAALLITSLTPDSAGADPSAAADDIGRRAAAVIATGGSHSCVLVYSGAVKCWGLNASGQLGYGDTDGRGDDPGEMGDALPAVDLGLGRTAMAISAGGAHTCALLDDASVKCWGLNASGQLGYGDTDGRGDDPGEMGDALPVADLGAGRTAQAISAGGGHTCALLDDASVKCWGSNLSGELGYGDEDSRGDDPGEMGDGLLPVDLGLGRTATAIATGDDKTCALLDDATLKCWGDGRRFSLGYADSDDRGDEPGEMGDALPVVDLGTGRTAHAIAAGSSHSCALLDDATVKCWGRGIHGQLGYGDTSVWTAEIGDDLPAVDLGAGRTAVAIAANDDHTCAILNDRAVKCWGWNFGGALGIGDSDPRGDEPGEMGDDLPSVDLGQRRTALGIAVGGRHTCVLLDDASVKCWGDSADGDLGYGDTNPRGDQPGEMGDLLPAVDLGTGLLASFPTQPAAPGAITAVGGQTVDVSWSPPEDDGGSHITGYSVQWTSNRVDWNTVIGDTGSTDTEVSLLTLPDGVYQLRVRALNDFGAGPYGPPSDPVTVSTTGPVATIDQASGQIDPTSATPVVFHVRFDQPVTGFTRDDLVVGGTAAVDAVTVTGAGADYLVTIEAVSQPGTIVLGVLDGAVTDSFGNESTTEVIDNSVTIVDDAPPTSPSSSPTGPTPTTSASTGTTPSTTTGTPTAELPATGSSALRALIAGAVLVSAGVATLAGARRPGRRPTE
ncbi:MAG: fibronectin type III domain-containing protein [Actinomycetota bacterium]